jgi:hypothetical protein
LAAASLSRLMNGERLVICSDRLLGQHAY